MLIFYWLDFRLLKTTLVDVNNKEVYKSYQVGIWQPQANKLHGHVDSQAAGVLLAIANLEMRRSCTIATNTKAPNSA
jgi:hypothetical protein